MRSIEGINPTSRPRGTGCEECLATGGWWLHLRRCAECGHIGCCDSSRNKLSVPIYLHPREPLPSQTRSIQGYPELVGSAWAFTYETASHAIRLMLSGLFDAYPKVQIILDHLGEGLPYILPRLQHRLDEHFEGAKARKRASFYFANHFWLTTSGHHHTKPFLEAVEQVGEDRLLFSVDYPYEQMSAVARWFDEAQFGNALKSKVGRENANRLLHLGLEAVSRSAAASFGG